MVRCGRCALGEAFSRSSSQWIKCINTSARHEQRLCINLPIVWINADFQMCIRESSRQVFFSFRDAPPTGEKGQILHKRTHIAARWAYGKGCRLQDENAQILFFFTCLICHVATVFPLLPYNRFICCWFFFLSFIRTISFQVSKQKMHLNTCGDTAAQSNPLLKTKWIQSITCDYLSRLSI